MRLKKIIRVFTLFAIILILIMLIIIVVRIENREEKGNSVVGTSISKNTQVVTPEKGHTSVSVAKTN